MTITIGVQLLLIVLFLFLWWWLSKKRTGFLWEVLVAFIVFALFFATGAGTEVLDFLERLFDATGQAKVTEGG